jgi:hypothetical protein
VTPDQQPCLCAGSYVCHRHTVAYKELRALARNITVSDDLWLNALHKSFEDNLHRLLEGAA